MYNSSSVIVEMGDTNLSYNDAALLINEGWNTSGNNTSFLSISHLLSGQAVLSQENTAVKFGNEKITYGELERRSNQLAHFLRDKGVKKEIIVPLLMERSSEM